MFLAAVVGSSTPFSTVRHRHVRLWTKIGWSRLATSVAEHSVTVTVAVVVAGAGGVDSVSSTVWIESTLITEDSRKMDGVKGTRLWHQTEFRCREAKIFHIIFCRFSLFLIILCLPKQNWTFKAWNTESRRWGCKWWCSNRRMWAETEGQKGFARLFHPLAMYLLLGVPIL